MTVAARRGVLLAAALLGAVVGAVLTMVLTVPGTPQPAVRGAPLGTSIPDTATRSPGLTAPSAEEPSGGGVLLVWTSGGLPSGLADTVRTLDGVREVTLVSGDEVRLTASLDASGQEVDRLEPGWHIPLDALAIDPSSFASFLHDADGDSSAVRALASDQALLTETSARLRRLGSGATIQIDGLPLTVAGVIDDLAGAGAEILVTTNDAGRVGVTTARYLLVSYTGDRDPLQRAVADRLHGRAVRFRSPAETVWLRHGDAVEPPARIKWAFGEFAIRDGGGKDVEIDPLWVGRWIRTESLPILGSVTCHQDVFAPLRAALTDLEEANLSHLVDPGAFAGCFSARRIASGQPLSHHAWGAALDLNVDGNPRGSFSTQDPRLVEAMARYGFTWGGTWLVPDPAHYEAPVNAP